MVQNDTDFKTVISYFLSSHFLELQACHTTSTCNSNGIILFINFQTMIQYCYRLLYYPFLKPKRISEATGNDYKYKQRIEPVATLLLLDEQIYTVTSLKKTLKVVEFSQEKSATIRIDMQWIEQEGGWQLVKLLLLFVMCSVYNYNYRHRHDHDHHHHHHNNNNNNNNNSHNKKEKEEEVVTTSSISSHF